MIKTISRYGIICLAAKYKSFTKAAETAGYTQSAVSQTVKTVENELGTELFIRSRGGISLSPDGEQFLPYFRQIYNAEKDLEQKKKEMDGLSNSTVVIGTFTSVSRGILPELMKNFRRIYPGVRFELRQGEYTGIEKWVKDKSVDFGFVCTDAVTDIRTEELYSDEMAAVLPEGHRLESCETVTLKQLSEENFILLDEGEYSVALEAFEKQKLYPEIRYKVYDDYSILEMVRQGLGVSVLYKSVIKGNENGIVIKEISEKPTRTVALAMRDENTLSRASRCFADYIIKSFEKESQCGA